MLLIGGNLLLARERLTEETAAFTGRRRATWVSVGIDGRTNSAELVREFHGDYRWDGVAYQPYKQDGSAPFKDISRQVLFHEPRLGCELRYFEMDAGGYSTLERHEHAHAVMILRGHGQCLLGDECAAGEAIRSGHAFRPGPGTSSAPTRAEPLGFLCMVNQQRDRPQLPTAEERRALQANPAVAKFLNG